MFRAILQTNDSTYYWDEKLGKIIPISTTYTADIGCVFSDSTKILSLTAKQTTCQTEEVMWIR